jgi:hypothetical protein
MTNQDDVAGELSDVIVMAKYHMIKTMLKSPICELNVMWLINAAACNTAHLHKIYRQRYKVKFSS